MLLSSLILDVSYYWHKPGFCSHTCKVSSDVVVGEVVVELCGIVVVVGVAVVVVVVTMGVFAAVLDGFVSQKVL